MGQENNSSDPNYGCKQRYRGRNMAPGDYAAGITEDFTTDFLDSVYTHVSSTSVVSCTWRKHHPQETSYLSWEGPSEGLGRSHQRHRRLRWSLSCYLVLLRPSYDLCRLYGIEIGSGPWLVFELTHRMCEIRHVRHVGVRTVLRGCNLFGRDLLAFGNAECTMKSTFSEMMHCSIK